MSKNTPPRIKITVLDVGDADAIIVQLWNDSGSLVMVIDGGRTGDFEEQMQPALIPILEAHSKAGPDVVVCTHYDADHIAGLIPLVRHYGDSIGEVWVHETPEVLTPLMQERATVFMIEALLMENATVRQRIMEEQFMIMESAHQLRQFLSVIPAGRRRPVFGASQPLQRWPEIWVLGPSRRYFNTLFRPNIPEQFLLTESQDADSIHDRRPEAMQESMGLTPCQRVNANRFARQTATNRASTIIKIIVGQQSYLFTGDAGLESFQNLENFPQCISNLHFLKIPHHGSINNLSRELIEIMSPAHAYSSGDQRQSPAVLDCIRTIVANADVRSTQQGTLNYPPV